MLAWQRNLYILFAVQLLSTVGFSMIFPFLPLYVADLGIATAGSIEFWAGMVFSAQAVTMMVASPIWGALADRRGRKLMLERATLGGAVLVALMGFAQNAEQLVVLRALQGAVSGVVAAATALVAAQTPREHSGYALGLINMARWGGVAAGPLIGGFIAETFGYRESFWITGALLGLAGLAVVFFVHEEFTPPDRAHRRSFWAGYRQLLAAPGMAGLYSLTFLRSLGSTLLVPILAFFVLELSQGVTAGAAMTTGLVIGAAALTSSLSAIYLGRLGDRFGHTRILAASAIAAALLYLPQVWVTTTWQLILLQALTGIAIGGLIPSVAALMNLWTDGGGQGAIYGLDNSVQASARVVAPLLAAAIAMLAGYRGVFAAGALVYAVIAVVAVAVARAAAGRAELQGTGD
ncbi:MAG: MFS transporter [Caldilineaceae bacterium]|nr:MFS transporter [Caldilineaceae bacterium]